MRPKASNRRAVWKQLYSLRDLVVLGSVGFVAYTFTTLGEGVEAIHAWTRAYAWQQPHALLLTLSFLAPVSFVLLVRRWYHLTQQMNQLERAQRTVLQSEGKYRSLFDNAVEGIYRSTIEGRFTEINLTLVRLLGYETKEEVLALDLAHDLYVQPAAREQMKAAVLAGKTVPGLEIALRKKDGTPITARLHVRGLFDEAEQLVGFEGIVEDITKQKRAEAALHESTQRFRDLFESSPDAIFVEDFKGAVLDANPAACRLHGLPRAHLVGRNVLDLIPEAYHASARRDFASMVTGELKRAEGYSWTSDGRAVPVEISVSRLTHNQRPALLLHVRDVTERKRAEEALQESEARYKQLVEEATDIIYWTDVEGHFTFGNPVALRTIGYNAEEILGQNYLMLVRPDYREEALYFYTRQLQERTPNTYYEFPALTKNYQELWLGQNVQLLWEEDQVVGFQAVARDITERKRYEKSLIAAKEKAEEMNRLKSTFLDNISHEIRTPLTSVIGFAEILVKETAGQHQEFSGFIERDGRRLLATLDAVLDLTRLEADDVVMHLEALDLSSEVAQIGAPFRRLATCKGLAFTMELPPAPVQATLDRACLHSILSHLLSNAIKFTDQGAIRLLLRKRENDIHIVVEDTGIGIDKAFKAHLFAAFKQESTGLARTHEGSGLGLAIAARLADKIGVRIEVASTKGEGSTFAVVIPIPRRASKPVPAPSQPAKRADRLVVDRPFLYTMRPPDQKREKRP